MSAIPEYFSFSRNPYDGENLSSMYDVGDLHVREISTRTLEIEWKFGNFFGLPQYRQLTQSYNSKHMFFHIYLSPKGIYEKEGFSVFWLAFRYKSSENLTEDDFYPNISCEFYVKTARNKLYKALRDRGRIAKFGGHCNSLIPRTELIGRNDSLVPGGTLTLVAKIQWKSKARAPIQEDLANPVSNDSGQGKFETNAGKFFIYFFLSFLFC